MRPPALKSRHDLRCCYAQADQTWRQSQAIDSTPRDEVGMVDYRRFLMSFPALREAGVRSAPDALLLHALCQPSAWLFEVKPDADGQM